MTNHEIADALVKEVRALGLSPESRLSYIANRIRLTTNGFDKANDENIGMVVGWLCERGVAVHVTPHPFVDRFIAFCTKREAWGYDGEHQRPDMALVLMLTSWLRENRDRVEVSA